MIFSISYNVQNKSRLFEKILTYTILLLIFYSIHLKTPYLTLQKQGRTLLQQEEVYLEYNRNEDYSVLPNEWYYYPFSQLKI